MTTTTTTDRAPQPALKDPRVVRDTTVLLKRSLRHVLRSPDTVITTPITPAALLLLFV